MLSQIKSMALIGLNGYLINVQVDVSNGMPSWEMVGLPDISIKESKQRVKAAIKNLGYKLPSRKIIINFAPANIKKEGPSFDLPIALGLLCDISVLQNNLFDDYVIIGELSLDGTLNKINGILPMCIEALNLGVKKAIIPFDNKYEASVVKGMEIYPAKHLSDVINHFNGSKPIEKLLNDINYLFSNRTFSSLNFSSVKGQEKIKRALEIAAAGGHNCLLIGSPGSGKTMMARRIPSILPDLTFEESLELTKIHSIAGTLPSTIPLITTRPFRNPHHTISKSALVGGGRIPMPGEISLAHYGVLFLDEIPEFKREILELLREPLEDGKVTINRVQSSFTYPSKFMLIASMNPCPCGYYGSTEKECSCTLDQVTKYMNRISGPLLDRIDIHIEVHPIKFDELSSKKEPESSEKIKTRVNNARKIQNERYKNDNIHSNSELTTELLKKYCQLDDDSTMLLKNAFEKLGFSARAHDKVIKLARTIADLESSENIKANHIAEAIQYRNLDRKYFT